MPNLRFSFADAHVKMRDGGWAREVTRRELPVASAIAGVNMRLTAGGVRELSRRGLGCLGRIAPRRRCRAAAPARDQSRRPLAGVAR
jgi:hypothetical protein